MTPDRSDGPRPSGRLRVAVTGAGGFVGSHLCTMLRSAGHEVIPLVRATSTRAADGTIVDLSRLDDVVSVLRSAAPDAVCHLAWEGHPRSAGGDYAGQLSTCVVPSTTLAVGAGIARVPHLLLVSSGGSVGRRPVEGRPPGAYGWAKHAAEASMASTAADFGMVFTALRPSAVYGPGQDPSLGLGVVSVFIDHVLRDEPVVLLGSGQSGRDFLHVDDLGACVQRVLEVRAAGTFEVGGPEVIRLDDLLRLLEESFGRSIKVERANPTGVDPELVQLDNAAIERAVGWRPSRRLVTELPDLVADLARRMHRAGDPPSLQPTTPPS